MTDSPAHFDVNVVPPFEEAAPLCHILNENNDELREMARSKRVLYFSHR